MMMDRRKLMLAMVFGAVMGTAGQDAQAHHGWRWALDEDFEITGTITAVRLGNPHGELTLDVDGQIWRAEIGQPWRNERAGLTAELLREGTQVTIHGKRSANLDQLLVKAERVEIDGTTYDLYPGR
jgi:hypothetical protein